MELKIILLKTNNNVSQAMDLHKSDHIIKFQIRYLNSYKLIVMIKKTNFFF